MLKISSIHNKKILSLRKLYKSRERKKQSVFLVEGYKEVLRGIRSSFQVEAVYFCPDIISTQNWNSISHILGSETEIFQLDKSVYEKLAYRGDTEGVLAVFKKRNFLPEEIINTSDNQLFIILESVEKPGNLGAILRTADAAGVDAIFLAEAKVDQYHPNVIRASLGGVFTVPVMNATNEEIFSFLTKYKIQSLAAALPSYRNIYELEMQKSTALIFGTEATGLSDFWLQKADSTYTIPMQGIVDSLNVSVSVSISIYEAVRQRIT
jgi:TrmH family RNA methyltransferase